jgi:hypothetical protein
MARAIHFKELNCYDLLAYPCGVRKGKNGELHWNMKRLMLMFIRSPMPTMVDRIDEPP